MNAKLKPKNPWQYAAVGLAALLLMAATLPNLTDIGANLTPDDLMYVVNNPGGAASDRKATVTNLHAYFLTMGATNLVGAIAGKQPLDSDLTALATTPAMYQSTNGVLTTIGGIGAGASGQVIWHDGTRWTNSAANVFQRTNAALTALATTPAMYQATNANLTILTGNDGSYLTNAVTGGATNLYQFVTLQQLQAAIPAGRVAYFTASPANGFGLTGTTKATNYAGPNLPAAAWTNTAVTSVNGNYIAAFVTTNTFTSFASGLAVVEVYCYEEIAGSGSITAEAYILNGTSFIEEYEFTPAPAYQAVPATSTPTKLTFSIPITDYVSTTNLHLMIKLKVSESSTPDPTIRIVGGGSFGSHVAFQIPGSVYLTKTEAAAGYQPLDSDLTTFAGIGAGASGDIIIRDASRWTNLVKSTDGKVLKLTSGLPSWQDDATAAGGESLGTVHALNNTDLDTDNVLVRVHGTGGTNVQKSVVVVGDTGAITGVNTLTATNTIEGGTLTEGGNAVYNSSETPGGVLGGTWASPTLDNSLSVGSWTITNLTVNGTLTTTLLSGLATNLDNLLGGNVLIDESGNVTAASFTATGSGGSVMDSLNVTNKLTNSILEASKLVVTTNDKSFMSATVGSGLSLSSGTLNTATTYQATNSVLTTLAGIGAGASGDIIIRDADRWTNLVKGADGKVLKLTSGIPSWETDSTASGNWTDSGTTNATLTGVAYAHGGVFTNSLTLNGTNVIVAYTGTGNAMRTRVGVVREVWIPASAMNPSASGPPAASTNAWGTTTDGQTIECWDFDADATETVQFTLSLPLAWDGADPKMKFVWKPVTDVDATETNVWQAVGGSINDNEDGGNTLGTAATVNDVALQSTNKVHISSAVTVDIGGTPSAGHFIWFKVGRAGNNAEYDSMEGDARLLGVWLQYTETTTEPSAW